LAVLKFSEGTSILGDALAPASDFGRNDRENPLASSARNACANSAGIAGETTALATDILFVGRWD
jgi:hypothetical protein